MAVYSILFGLSIFMIAFVMAIIKRMFFHWKEETKTERLLITTTDRPAVNVIIYADKCVIRRRTYCDHILVYDVISKEYISINKESLPGITPPDEDFFVGKAPVEIPFINMTIPQEKDVVPESFQVKAELDAKMKEENNKESKVLNKAMTIPGVSKDDNKHISSLDSKKGNVKDQENTKLDASDEAKNKLKTTEEIPEDAKSKVLKIMTVELDKNHTTGVLNQVAKNLSDDMKNSDKKIVSQSTKNLKTDSRNTKQQELSKKDTKTKTNLKVGPKKDLLNEAAKTFTELMTVKSKKEPKSGDPKKEKRDPYSLTDISTDATSSAPEMSSISDFTDTASMISEDFQEKLSGTKDLVKSHAEITVLTASSEISKKIVDATYSKLDEDSKVSMVYSDSSALSAIPQDITDEIYSNKYDSNESENIQMSHSMVKVTPDMLHNISNEHKNSAEALKISDTDKNGASKTSSKFAYDVTNATKLEQGLKIESKMSIEDKRTDTNKRTSKSGENEPTNAASNVNKKIPSQSTSEIKSNLTNAIKIQETSKEVTNTKKELQEPEQDNSNINKKEVPTDKVKKEAATIRVELDSPKDMAKSKILASTQLNKVKDEDKDMANEASSKNKPESVITAIKLSSPDISTENVKQRGVILKGKLITKNNNFQVSPKTSKENDVTDNEIEISSEITDDKDNDDDNDEAGASKRVDRS